MSIIKKAFCWLYHEWLKHFVATKNAPLVRFLDFFFGSACKYCMSSRSLVAGVGIGVFINGWLLTGAALFGLAWIMAYGERKWLCEVKSE